MIKCNSCDFGKMMASTWHQPFRWGNIVIPIPCRQLECKECGKYVITPNMKKHNEATFNKIVNVLRAQ